MTAAIDDVSSLPGKKIRDQAYVQVGKIKEIYATDDGYPMWVAVEMSSSTEDNLSGDRIVFIPLARLKVEQDELHVPYSKQRIAEAPEVDDGDGISAECDRALRDYYGIDAGDQEMRKDNDSYAARVPDEAGAASRVEDASSIETPDADTRTEETMKRLAEPAHNEARKVTAEDVSHDTQDMDKGESDEGDDAGERDKGDDDTGERDEDDDDAGERDEDEA
jgi:hypothetical protein